MEETQMTDSELIKALENSINTYNQKGIYVDTENIQQQALDLLKRQKKELEAIKDEKALVFKLSEEQINETKEDLLKSVEYNERKIKAKAYKEFAEKAAIELTNAYSSEYAHWIDDTLNNLLEELVGDDK